jgi:hypothetical protein
MPARRVFQQNSMIFANRAAIATANNTLKSGRNGCEATARLSKQEFRRKRAAASRACSPWRVLSESRYGASSTGLPLGGKRSKTSRGFVLTSAVPIIIFALLVFVLLALAGVVLLSLVLRYRAGTARRQARRWAASLNVWMTSFSAVFFLCFTFLLSFWVGSAFRFALIGMGVGGILGLFGLTLTRWESQSEALFYTPSRWLAFLIIFAIAARVLYGWWRTTHSGSNAPGDQHWLITASGTQFSLAVAAGLIGYYLVYSVGVRLRVARYEQGRRDFKSADGN